MLTAGEQVEYLLGLGYRPWEDNDGWVHMPGPRSSTAFPPHRWREIEDWLRTPEHRRPAAMPPHPSPGEYAGPEPYLPNGQRARTDAQSEATKISEERWQQKQARKAESRAGEEGPAPLRRDALDDLFGGGAPTASRKPSPPSRPVPAAPEGDVAPLF